MNEEMLNIKRECKRLLLKYNHTVKACRANNSRFNSNIFQEDCLQENQKFIFCRVDVYHQNRISKALIQRIVEDIRIFLFHAKREWPQVIATNL